MSIEAVQERNTFIELEPEFSIQLLPAQEEINILLMFVMKRFSIRYLVRHLL